MPGIGGGEHALKIQVVDDNETNLILFSQLAEGLNEDVEVETFLDPRDAFAACRQAMPDLILVDYMMPGMNGHDFIAQVRALPDAHDVPIIMVTADDERQVRHRALDLGATDFLTKPVDPTEVKTRLRNLLALRRGHLKLQNTNSWLAEEVRKATQTVFDREEELVLRLAKAAELRDPETGCHIQRMAHYSELIARHAGLGGALCALLLRAAPMHDLGKMGIPDGILLKPGRLDEREMQVMRQHPEIGHTLLKNSSSHLIELAAEIALTHHEKWDGGGYPRGLAGDSIPVCGRIVAIADVFDALTSERPYKRAWSLEQARAYIADNAGSHFDPFYAGIFLAHWDEVEAIHARFQDDPDPIL